MVFPGITILPWQTRSFLRNKSVPMREKVEFWFLNVIKQFIAGL
jgi:hypothetical protein